MRIIITGDRNWYATDVAEDVLNRLILRHGPSIVIVHGADPNEVVVQIDNLAFRIPGHVEEAPEPEAEVWDRIYEAISHLCPPRES